MDAQRWRRLQVALVLVLAVAVAGSIAAAVVSGPHRPQGGYERCKARMAGDLHRYGAVNEQAPECRGLSPDTLAQIEIEILGAWRNGQG